MLCKYCNADLKPEDKVCPVCEKPLNNIESLTNQDVVNDVGNVSENIMEGLDKSIFEPIQPQDLNVVESTNIEDTPVVIEESINSNIDVESIEEQPVFVNEVSSLDSEQVNNTNDFVQMPKPVNEVNNISISSTQKIEYKKRNMSFTAVIIIAFLVVLLGFLFFVMSSPKMIFTNFINKAYKQVNSNIITDVKNMSGTMSLQTKISSPDESSNGIFEILNNIYLGIDYEIDYKNENALMKLNTKYDNEKLLDTDIYVKDEIGYILLKDIYDKYLSVDVGDFDDLFEQIDNIEDYKVVVTELKKAITKSLKSEYFTKEKVDVNLNNKTRSVNKNILVLNAEVISKIEKDILTYLKNNNEFIDSLSEVIEIEKTEILTNVEEILKSDEIGSNNTEVIMSIYTKGILNEVVKIDLETNNSGEKSIIELKEESENNYSIVLNSMGSIVNGTVKLLENDKEKTKVEINFTDPTSNTTIGLTIGMSTKYNTELTNVDISNSVDSNTLTEEETNEIMTKLMENKGIQNLMSAFEGIIYSDSNYDVEYDYYDEYGNQYICGDGVECHFRDEVIY